jgi:hypothetical protein
MYHVQARPLPGYNYFIAHLTISRVNSVYLKGITDKSRLIDTEGREYNATTLTFQGGTLKDRYNIDSELLFEKGATFTIIYEIPIEAKPATLKLLYSYSDSLEEKVITQGQIDIKILTSER